MTHCAPDAKPAGVHRTTKGLPHEFERDEFFQAHAGATPRPAAGIGGALHRCARASRAFDGGDPDSRAGGGPAARRRLRRDDGDRQDRRRRAVAQRRGADRHAARQYGCAAGRGRDRPALCQQSQGYGPRREHGAGHACLRPRHARCLARRRNDAPGASPRRLAGHFDGGVPAGGGDGGRRSGDDR